MKDVKVGRNNLCTCGSGKKFKKCCGNKVVAIGHLYEQDMLELQMSIIEYAITKYEMELEELMDDFSLEFFLPDEIEEIFYFHLANWIIFNIELEESDKTILEEFRSERLPLIKRPRLKDDFVRWANIAPSLAEIKEIVDNKTIIVNDYFSGEQKRIKIIDQTEMEFIPQQLVAGIVVPYGEDYTFFTAPIDLPLELTSVFAESLNKLHSAADEPDPEEFMRDYYPDILNLIFVETVVDMTIEDIQWNSEKQAEVVQRLNAEMKEAGTPKEMIQTATVLWHHYCQKKSPNIKNPNIYAAVLHYLIGDLIGFGLSQKVLANIYGVSTSAISSRYNELKSVLEEEIAAIEMHVEDDFDEYWDDIFDEDDWEETDEVDLSEFDEDDDNEDDEDLPL